MKVNWNSILSKAQDHMNTSRRKRDIDDKTDQIMLGDETASPNGWHTAEGAGLKFANVLIHEINTSALPERVIDRLGNAVDVGRAVKIGPGKYMVGVFFDGDLDRETMSTKKEYYPVNLVRLYNDGVDHVMDQIWETYPDGSVHTSLTVIPGAHFMEQTVDDFGGNYGSEYRVIEININNN